MFGARDMTRPCFLAVMIGVAVPGYCSGAANARSADAAVGLAPGWADDATAVMAQYYPPAQTRLLVAGVPEPLTDALRHAGYQVVEAPDAGALGNRLSVATVSDPAGVYVILRIGGRALSSLWGPSGRLTSWSVGEDERGAKPLAKGQM